MTRPVKLLQIGKHFTPDTGGIETVTANLSAVLPDEGIAADVLCLGFAGKAYPAPSLPFRVIRAKADFQVGNKVFSSDYVRKVRQLSDHYDIGLLHMPNPLGAAAARVFWRKPLLLLWHADTPQPRLRSLLRPLDRLVVRQARIVIAPTPAHAHGSYLAGDIACKSRIAPYPFRLGRTSPADETEALQQVRRFAGTRRLVLAVGRLVPYKGFSVIIEAARALPEDSAVVIVGSGGLATELSKLIDRLNLQSRVMLTGELADGDLAGCYRAADIVCMPSITAAEMYGMVQVEAMAHGRPVVSTNIANSGVSWVNQHGRSGLVVEPNDPAALAAALRLLLTDPSLLAQLSDGAGQVFKEHHESAASARNYAKIIRDTVN